MAGMLSSSQKFFLIFHRMLLLKEVRCTKYFWILQMAKTSFAETPGCMVCRSGRGRPGILMGGFSSTEAYISISKH